MNVKNTSSIRPVWPASHQVLIWVLVGGFFYEIAHGIIGGSFTYLGALSGAVFMLFTIYFKYKI
jgi:hypothetical protein